MGKRFVRSLFLTKDTVGSRTELLEQLSEAKSKRGSVATQAQLQMARKLIEEESRLMQK